MIWTILILIPLVLGAFGCWEEGYRKRTLFLLVLSGYLLFLAPAVLGIPHINMGLVAIFAIYLVLKSGMAFDTL